MNPAVEHPRRCNPGRRARGHLSVSCGFGGSDNTGRGEDRGPKEVFMRWVLLAPEGVQGCRQRKCALENVEADRGLGDNIYFIDIWLDFVAAERGLG